MLIVQFKKADLNRNLTVEEWLFGALGMTEPDFSVRVEKSQRFSSMMMNPGELTSRELEQILKEAL